MEESKVCPKCGMQLVGKNNYCMGCGVNVDLEKHDGSVAQGGFLSNGYGKVSRFSEKEVVARLRAAQGKREKKQKKNILFEGGLTTVLFVMLALVVGVTAGVFALKWYFAPKESTVTFLREEKVTDFAGIERIDPPKQRAFVEIPDPKGNADKKKEKDKDANESSELNPQRKEANPEWQKFQETRTIHALGDKVLEWEEEMVWDVTDLDPNSVTYVVNHLYYQIDALRDHVFIEQEITRSEEAVVIHVAYRHLDLEENVIELARLKVIGSDQTMKAGGKRYLSLERTMKAFKDEGWKQEGEESQTTVIYLD